MKKIFAVMILAIFFSASFVLAEEESKKGLEFSYEVTGGTRYVSDFGVTYLRDLYFENKATLSNETGWYLTASNVYNPKRKFNSGEEAGWFDFYFGKEGEIGSIKYDAYVGYYNREIGKINDGDTPYAGMKLSFPKLGPLTPFIAGEYYYIIRQTSQNGLAWSGGFESEFRGVQIKVFATGHNQVFESNSALIASGIASISYELEIYKNVKLVPTVSYQQRLEKKERNGGLSQGGFWGGLTLTWTF